MGNFCKHCGNRTDGTVCGCPASQAVAAPPHTPPDGFTYDPNSGWYYRYTPGYHPDTGVPAQIVTWFDPHTGKYEQVCYQNEAQPQAQPAQARNTAPVAYAAPAPVTPARKKRSPVLIILAVIILLLFVVPPIIYLLFGPDSEETTSTTATAFIMPTDENGNNLLGNDPATLQWGGFIAIQGEDTFFVNFEDNGTLYCTNRDGSLTKLTDFAVANLSISGDVLIFTDLSGCTYIDDETGEYILISADRHDEVFRAAGREYRIDYGGNLYALNGIRSYMEGTLTADEMWLTRIDALPGTIFKAPMLVYGRLLYIETTFGPPMPGASGMSTSPQKSIGMAARLLYSDTAFKSQPLAILPNDRIVADRTNNKLIVHAPGYERFETNLTQNINEVLVGNPVVSGTTVYVEIHNEQTFIREIREYDLSKPGEAPKTHSAQNLLTDGVNVYANNKSTGLISTVTQNADGSLTYTPVSNLRPDGDAYINKNKHIAFDTQAADHGGTLNVIVAKNPNLKDGKNGDYLESKGVNGYYTYVNPPKDLLDNAKGAHNRHSNLTNATLDDDGKWYFLDDKGNRVYLPNQGPINKADLGQGDPIPDVFFPDTIKDLTPDPDPSKDLGIAPGEPIAKSSLSPCAANPSEVWPKVFKQHWPDGYDGFPETSRFNKGNPTAYLVFFEDGTFREILTSNFTLRQLDGFDESYQPRHLTPEQVLDVTKRRIEKDGFLLKSGVAPGVLGYHNILDKRDQHINEVGSFEWYAVNPDGTLTKQENTRRDYEQAWSHIPRTHFTPMDANHAFPPDFTTNPPDAFLNGCEPVDADSGKADSGAQEEDEPEPDEGDDDIAPSDGIPSADAGDYTMPTSANPYYAMSLQILDYIHQKNEAGIIAMYGGQEKSRDSAMNKTGDNEYFRFRQAIENDYYGKGNGVFTFIRGLHGVIGGASMEVYLDGGGVQLVEVTGTEVILTVNYYHDVESSPGWGEPKAIVYIFKFDNHDKLFEIWWIQEHKRYGAQDEILPIDMKFE